MDIVEQNSQNGLILNVTHLSLVDCGDYCAPLTKEKGIRMPAVKLGVMSSPEILWTKKYRLINQLTTSLPSGIHPLAFWNPHCCIWKYILVQKQWGGEENKIKIRFREAVYV